MDILSKEKRSHIMAGIKSKNTIPEMLVRKKLFSLGLRYRIHVSSLPGKPDIVLKKYKTIILVNGCFWHNHNCKYAHNIKTNPSFWQEKLQKNINRDKLNIEKLRDLGWKVLVIWECSILDDFENSIQELYHQIID